MSEKLEKHIRKKGQQYFDKNARKVLFRAWLNGEYIYWEAGDKSNWFWEQVRGFDLTLEQYTGLKDKNGVKIYEGDVLKFNYMGEDFIGPVTYKTDGFRVAPRGECKLLFGLGVVAGCTSHSLLPGEVIGNIHENLELLK